MKLYHCPQTRSFRPLWLLEEAQIDYEIEVVNIFQGEGRKDEYLAINPYGKVPTLNDDGLLLYEAGAICMYLTDNYAAHLAPVINSPDRGRYYQWMFFVPATMEPPLMSILLHTKLLPDSQRLPALVEQGKKQFNAIAENLNQTLDDNAFLVGNQFTTADIMLASTLQWLPELIEEYSALKNYVHRLTQRPAYLRAKAK